MTGVDSHLAAATRADAAVVAAGLEAARRRTAWLTDVDERELTAQHSPLMSPLVWDLAHIGQQEDLWLLRGGDAGAQGLLAANVERLYDAFEQPRAIRVTLPLLTAQESRAYLGDVRSRVLDALAAADEDDDLFPHVMVEQHEQQHVETMLATHQLRGGAPVLGARAVLPPDVGRDDTARALTFVVLVLANLGLIHVNRSWGRTAWRGSAASNRQFGWIAAGTVAVLGAVLGVPAISRLLAFATPAPWLLLAAGGAAALVVMWFEAVKQVQRRRLLWPA